MEKVAEEDAVPIVANILFSTKNVEIAVLHMSKLWNGIKKAVAATGRGAVYVGEAYANNIKDKLWSIQDFEDQYYNLSIDELKKMYEKLEGDERFACAVLIDKKRKMQNS